MNELIFFAKELEESILSGAVENKFDNIKRFAIKKEISKLNIQINEIENISDTLSEYSILALWWFSLNLNINNPNIKNYSINCLKLILLCNKFLVFDFGIKIGEHFVNNNYINEKLCRDSIHWFIMLNYAKCLRREGKYETAYSLYARIAKSISKNNDISAHAQLLLHMGKSAHNHQWRTGYSLCLTEFATKRFQLLLKKNEIGSSKYKDYARFLAICLDSQAKIIFEVNKDTTYDQSKLKLFKKIKLIWRKALNHAKEADNYNSEIRIICRSSIANFQLAETQKNKLLALNEFRSALKKLEAVGTDQRGLAVRFRQYAEMLAQFDSISYKSDIEFYLKKSVEYAKNEKDWRTQTINQIALSKIFFNTQYENIKFTTDNIKLALLNLELNLCDRFPEIEVDANLELARQLRSSGNYRDSKEYLRKAHDIVLELEKRLYSEIEQNTYVPMCLLTQSEKYKVREALFSDFKLLSLLIHEVANEQRITADLAASQVATELQLAFYQDCLRGHAHSFKGIIANFKAGVERLHIGDHSLYMELTKTAEQVEKNFNELLFDNTSLITDFVSAHKSLEKVISEIKNFSMFKDVSFELVSNNNNNSDFSIYCCPKIFESVLDNLIVNAARAAINSSICDKKTVTVRVLVRSNIKSERYFGIIEIENTGRDIEKLKISIDIATTSKQYSRESNKTYGIPHAVQFLKGFNGKLNVYFSQEEYTLLSIEIPIGERIKYE